VSQNKKIFFINYLDCGIVLLAIVNRFIYLPMAKPVLKEKIAQTESDILQKSQYRKQ
jgi:hypothetical protein